VTVGLVPGVPAPGNEGANETWDMSGLAENEEQFFDFVDPATTAWGDEFPDATLCGLGWLDSYTYYNTTGGALTVEGHVIIARGDTVKTIFDDTEQIVTLPYTHGTTFIDTFDGEFHVDPLIVPFSGTLDSEADGYGTLILPNATYNNVARYHFFREQTNGTSQPTQTKEQWAWVLADRRFWLLLMETNFDGFSYNHQIWYDKNPSPTPTDDMGWGELKATFR